MMEVLDNYLKIMLLRMESTQERAAVVTVINGREVAT